MQGSRTSRIGSNPIIAAPRALAVVASCLWVAACDGAADGRAVDRGEARSDVPVPAAVLASRAVDPSALALVVTVDGRPADAVERDGVWTVSIEDARGKTVTLAIEWYERFRGEELLLATLTREVDTSLGGGALTIGAGEYVTDVHDDDADGRSNLAERGATTDPYNARDPGGDSGENGEVRVDVRVPAIDPADAPTVNGSFGAKWNPAVAIDENGEPLVVDRLLSDEGGIAAGDLPGYRWYAMHDLESLYLYVTFGRRDGRVPSQDSATFADDDTLNLYIDGNHSRSATLDDGDRFLAIPASTLPGDRRPPVVAPSVAAPVVPSSLEYGFCLCINASVGGWEVKVALAELGIVPGEPFGFEVQIDQDVDKGSRDARWGWSNPSLGERDADYVADSPAFNGTLVLDVPDEGDATDGSSPSRRRAP